MLIAKLEQEYWLLEKKLMTADGEEKARILNQQVVVLEEICKRRRQYLASQAIVELNAYKKFVSK